MARELDPIPLSDRLALSAVVLQSIQETSSETYPEPILFNTIGVGGPNDASTPNDNAASTSSSIDQELLTVDPVMSSHGELPQGASREPFNLESMETVRLRRTETITEESLVSKMTKLKAHVLTADLEGYPARTTSQEARLTWAKDKVNEARNEWDELSGLITELTATDPIARVPPNQSVGGS